MKVNYRTTTCNLSSLRAFTLIELLIVVAIIAILAAIAVPNFLEAQTRAKISRVQSDIRALTIAAETYRIDNNKYPLPGDRFINGTDISWTQRQLRLTTPIAYISSLPRDPFRSPLPGHNPDGILDFEVRGFDGYGGVGDIWFQQDRNQPLTSFEIQVFVRSWGPDNVGDLTPPWTMSESPYDPTNGTKSGGDIWGFLPGPVFFP